MNIVIFGAGLIGRQVAETLERSGHEVRALGLSDGIDTTTGAGVAEALHGAEVVLDLTNSRSWADDDVLEFFRASTRQLLAAEEKAGVRHHVILSIVGADRLTDSGYMRAKLAQEDLVRTGPVPSTIVRSTQFFEFLPGIADAGTTDGIVRATSGRLQPIASRDIVAYVSQIATRAPAGATVEAAGPSAHGIDELLRRLFATTGDSRQVITDDEAGYFGAALDATALLPTPGADAWIGPTTLEEWLRTRS